MDAMESEAVEHSISTQASRVEEQQLEVDDGRLAELEQIARSADPKSVVPSTELLIEPVSLPLPDRLQARLVSMATNLLRRVRFLGFFLLWIMHPLWGKMKRASWGGGDDADADTDTDTDTDTDADLVNFLTNMYLTDFFSLEKSRKVLCLLARPSRDKEANETADRLLKNTSVNKHFKGSVLVQLPDDGPADSATILAEILLQIPKTEDQSAGKDRIEIIKEALKHMRYLVLIPNLRGAETWKEIGGAFPENGKSSRVIITTSRLEVAEECTSAESDLIYKVDAGTAASADGNMLSEEDEDALLSECTDDSLRNCSLYLSTVKDGDVLFEEAMVRKWVAEELIKEEKMGHEHFHDLLSRGVIQEEPGPQRFRAEPAYVVNRRMLPHLRHKSEHGKFAAHVHAGSAEEASGHPKVATGIPRLSLTCEPSTTTTTTTTTSQPAVLLLPDDHRPKPTETFFNNMMMMFTRRKTEQQRRRILGHARSLTVSGHCKGLLSELDGDKLLLLDLQGCQDLNNSDVVYICGHLRGLKYLSFNGTPVSEIPPDIEELQRLETLDLRETKVTVLPPQIYKLPRLEHMFVSDWLKMAEGYSAEVVRSNVKNHRLLLNIAVLDIRICQLTKGDLEKLGNMENLQSLALTLLGIQTEEMVITKDPLFKKLRVFSLDCRVAWITFREGPMPELRRLYLWLYAGPPGKTPSGTNHLKKLHEVTLRYDSGNYEKGACVKETTRIMKEEDTMRARATTFVTNGKEKVPQIQVPTHSKKTLVLLVLKLLRSFYDCIPYTKRLRPKLAEWIERRPALAIPLLYLAFFILVAILVMMAPLLIKVAIWLARRALHAAALIFLHRRYGNWTFIVSGPILAYHLFCIIILAYYVMSPAVQLVCATILGLLRLVLLYILTPLGYTLAALFSLLAPLVFVYYLPSLPHYLHTLLRRFFTATLLPRFPNLLPPLPKLVLSLSAATGTIVFFIRILLLWLYFSPRLLCSTVTAILQLVRTITEWLILGA